MSHFDEFNACQVETNNRKWQSLSDRKTGLTCVNIHLEYWTTQTVFHNKIAIIIRWIFKSRIALCLVISETWAYDIKDVMLNPAHNDWNSYLRLSDIQLN